MSDVQRLTKLAQLRQEVFSNVARLDDELKRAKKELDRYDTEEIPEMMTEIGMSSFTLEDGTQLSLAEDVKTSITKERAPAAISWLLANGYGGIIKTQVGVELPKGDHEAATKIYEQLSDNDGAFMKETVHPMTLKSFVKERLEAGDDIPFDAFSIYPFNKVKVRLP